MKDAQKRRITIVKFGGGVIGESGQGIPQIVNRIQSIRTKDGIGPVVVVSAPKGLTDQIIKIGHKRARGLTARLTDLMKPYQLICEAYIRHPFQNDFTNHLTSSFKEVEEALERVERNREFEGGPRAIVLAYCGELLMATAMSYILTSQNIETYNMYFKEWPIITDKNFDSATFLYEESQKHSLSLLKRIEEGKIVTIGGFIGKTVSGRETTYERGGSDRTAINLGLLLKPDYDVCIDLEKENVVLSADPQVQGIKKGQLRKIKYLSYNEARLAGQYGMQIIDPLAIRDIKREMNLPIHVTSISTGETTKIQRYPDETTTKPIKIVTGRRNCAIVEFNQSKSASIYDYLERIQGYFEFSELRPYSKNGIRISRFLFFDGRYLKEHLVNDLQRIDSDVRVEYGLAAVTLIGDKMAQASGIVALAYDGIRTNYPDLVILDGDVQRPTSSILLIVREKDKDRCVSAIHEVSERARVDK